MVFTYLPLRRAAIFGVVAYLAGYLLTVAVTGGLGDAIMTVRVSGQTIESIPVGEILVDTPSRWVVAGWIFYNAQLIPTNLPAADAIGGFASSSSRSLILSLNGFLFSLYLVPLACVSGAGYATSRTGPTYGVRGSMYAGAGVAISYYPLLVIGSFLFFVDVPDVEMLATPAHLATIFIGLAYSVGIGAFGGWLASTRY